MAWHSAPPRRLPYSQLAVLLHLALLAPLQSFVKAHAQAASTTPLLVAAGEGDLERVNALLAAGEDPNQANDDGETPLHTACIWAKEGVVRALLEAGADPNVAAYGPKSLDMTPLTWCLYGGYLNDVQALLEAGADPNPVVRKSEVEKDVFVTPLDIVTDILHGTEHEAALTKLLLSHGAKHHQDLEAVAAGGSTTAKNSNEGNREQHSKAAKEL